MGGDFKRRQRLRSFQETLLIVVEGQTEGDYFRDAIAERTGMKDVRMTVKPATGGSVTDILEMALRLLDKVKPDRLWCVLDADTYKASDEKIRKNAEQRGVRTAFSNPCFEVWFLFHFERGDGAIADCERAKSEVKALPISGRGSRWTQLQQQFKEGTPFKKAEWSRKRTGKNIGESYLHNPSTDVDELMRALGFGPPPPDQDGLPELD